jgi:hypothetical protein
MLDAINGNKMFLGIMLIVLNIGSRHLIDEISTDDDEYRRNIVLRRIAIFAVCFVGTRDLVISLLLTAGFIIIASGISRRSREGMENEEKEPISEADQPAYDSSVPPMFLENA